MANSCPALVFFTHCELRVWLHLQKISMLKNIHFEFLHTNHKNLQVIFKLSSYHSYFNNKLCHINQSTLKSKNYQYSHFFKKNTILIFLNPSSSSQPTYINKTFKYSTKNSGVIIQIWKSL